MKLPESAQEALRQVNESFFSGKPLSGTVIKRFDLIHARSALGKAAREGADDQVSIGIYAAPSKGHQESLVVLRAGDLARLLDMVEMRARS